MYTGTPSKQYYAYSYDYKGNLSWKGDFGSILIQTL